ncbi:hypothetical protein AB840_15120, partial [Megasphaera cerevisiae DSM 20462]
CGITERSIKMKTIMPWINSRHPQNKVIEEPDPEFDRYMRQAEIYQELSDEADRAMAFAIILGALLFGVLMIITAMYRDGMIMI